MSPLRGLAHFIYPSPGLTAWAITFRPFGPYTLMCRDTSEIHEHRPDNDATPKKEYKNSPDISFVDMTIKGGSLPLDDIHWPNVIFISTRIRYKGGAIDLQGVHFANCTFDIPPSPLGESC